MTPSRVLVLGSGGREHALAWRLARDPEQPSVVVAPGNPGMARGFSCRPVDPLDAPAVVALAARERADLVVVGPEAPLAAGLVDALEDAGVTAFGPRREAARLESSKWFAKEVQRAAGVPTARAEAFEALPPARAALERFDPPWVLKADGLAAGKGVRVTRDRAEAEAFLAACLEGDRFGASGRRVVIEEFLAGEEASVFAVCDGERFVLLPAARDFKRARDGDAGSNTGGMGAYAPAPHVDAEVRSRVERRVVGPLLAEMRRRGAPFRGLLYCGLMVKDGIPSVVEFNVRFGDPETQVVVPLLEGSLGRLLRSAARGALEPGVVWTAPGVALAVALVDEGYPDAPRGDGSIEGLESLESRGDITVFHAGLAREGGVWRVRPGRAAYVMAAGRELGEAHARVYGAIDTLGGAGWRCRRDIGRPEAASGTRREG